MDEGRIMQETLRYLGYRRQQPDSQVAALLADCMEELKRAVTCRHVKRESPLHMDGEAGIRTDLFSAESRNLGRNLKDCQAVLVFAATVGIGADQLIQRYERVRVSRAVVIQAMAAAMIEEYCDCLNREWKEEYEAAGWYLRPRFSPGYGDFPLECQREILEGLEAGKRIGLTLTDSLIMMPSKSVTAVIGVSRIPAGCAVEGCEACGRTDCEYRRN